MSSIVEGFGDGLFISLIVILLAVLLVVAWQSTNVQERPLIRAVVVLDSSANVHGLSTEYASAINPQALSQAGSSGEGGAERPNNPTEMEQPVETMVEKSDSSHGDAGPAQEHEDSDQESEDEVAECLEDSPRRRDQPILQNNTLQLPTEDVRLEEGCILIRLIFLNDTRKLVEGRLQERLGEFKRRHFSLELAANKLVRLIFNGQVLQSDTETLEHYGLHHNCVLHCVVHQPRQTERPDSPGPPEASNDLDFGNILFILLGVILGFAWYCHFQYSQYFTGTSTIALVGLSGFFMVSVIGLYFPEWEGFR